MTGTAVVVLRLSLSIMVRWQVHVKIRFSLFSSFPLSGILRRPLSHDRAQKAVVLQRNRLEGTGTRRRNGVSGVSASSGV